MPTTTTLQFPILRMPWTDPSNTAHPNAVWFLAEITQDALSGRAGLEWYGYDVDSDLLADLTTNLAAGTKNFTPIGQKSYQLTMPQFAQFATALGPAGATLMGSEFMDAVGLAQQTLDTPNTATPPVMVSFFATATVDVITLTLPTGN